MKTHHDTCRGGSLTRPSRAQLDSFDVSSMNQEATPVTVAQQTPAAAGRSQRTLVGFRASAGCAAAGTQARARGHLLGLRVSRASGSGSRHRLPQQTRQRHLGRHRRRLPARRKRWPTCSARHAIPRSAPTWSMRPQALQGFRLGKYDLVITPDGKEGFQYRYDPARPESVLARAEVDDALAIRCRTQGSGAHISGYLQRAGFSLHRFPDPWPAGNEPDELRHVGHWLCPGGHAPAQGAQAFRRYSYAAQRLSAGSYQQPAGADGDRDRAAARLRRAGLSHARAGFIGRTFCSLPPSARSPSEVLGCSLPAGRRNWKASAV